jgi:hypothetical protein
MMAADWIEGEILGLANPFYVPKFHRIEAQQ